MPNYTGSEILRSNPDYSVADTDNLRGTWKRVATKGGLLIFKPDKVKLGQPVYVDDADGNGNPSVFILTDINNYTDPSYSGWTELAVSGAGVSDWNSITGKPALYTESEVDNLLSSKADGTDLTNHVNNTNNPHSVTKSQVGLSNVPNIDTTDAVNNEHTHSNKTELDLITDGDHDVRNDNPHNVTATQIGLGNVDNTSDLDKPISTATQTALNDKYDASNPNGFETPAELDARDTANRDRANHTGTQSASTISDFVSAVQAAETTTSLSFNANILTFTDENGVDTNLDLSIYLDDTNLARIVSGTLDSGTGIATFTRDDASTFTVDFSSLNDQAAINSAISNHESAADPHPQYETSAETQAKVDAHANLTNNPHNVDKTDVGLSNVPNLDTTGAVNKAHDQNTDTGTDNNTFHIDSGNNGPKAKNNSGELEVRNSGDTGFTSVQVRTLFKNAVPQQNLTGQLGDISIDFTNSNKEAFSYTIAMTDNITECIFTNGYRGQEIELIVSKDDDYYAFDFAQPYDESTGSSIGDYVLENNKVYKCNTAQTAGDSFNVANYDLFIKFEREVVPVLTYGTDKKDKFKVRKESNYYLVSVQHDV